MGEKTDSGKEKYDLCVIGGAGHVGLPLGVQFALNGVKTAIFDINHDWLDKIQKGKFPFKEDGGDLALEKALKSNYFYITNSPEAISKSDFIILVTGTPIDEYLNPNVKVFNNIIESYLPYFKDGQILILRSTVFPGTTERVQKTLWEKGKKINLAFCPERIVQGKAIKELKEIPQIISGFNEQTMLKVENLFKKISSQIIRLKPVEAELTKLFCNAWRYIKFAAANQFFMITKEHDIDFSKIHKAMTFGYPRNKDFPSPGFTAGPCLFKDTMQLAAFYNNNFFLGHAAMLINEGLPSYMIQKIKKDINSNQNNNNLNKKIVARTALITDSILEKTGANFKNKVIGILGMSFKAESDDIRDSLSFKLKKIAQNEFQKVLCHDAHINNPSFTALTTLLNESDIIILATPHKAYKKINPRLYPNKIFIDIWNFWNKK